MTADLQWWPRLAADVRAAGRGDLAVQEPLLEMRDRLGFDCAALVAHHRPVVNLSYPSEAFDYLASTYSRTCPVHQHIVRRGVPMRFVDVPFDLHETRTYQDVIAPNRFREGVTLPLPDGGFVALSSTHARPLDERSLMALAMLAYDLAALADPGADDRRADLVLAVARDQVEVRAGSLDESPLSPGDLRLTARLSATRPQGLRFAHRAVDGTWWWVHGVRRPRVAVVRLGRASVFGDLTSRELDVVGLVARGWSNEQVSRALGIAVRTVRSHVESAMGKLGCANRTALARSAVENDLDSIDALRVASAFPLAGRSPDGSGPRS
ncbi:MULTISPECIES: LuxR family transcriptional regulator [unclassified Nocardioides]|uniref:helix-turn-helix transcriptional regulator n=1 Tax=unclassified Nocardioides TaxID=2615069 RepID=UPI0011733CBF|nr:MULTISPECIES: LuxR family transcriptional regulator [unclassified Nocardioides]TQK73325.1 autoinducer binding domain-containing protein [Nocardioides sp. SLBN-35]WGY02424.1 LuxR C-terminal-related transcriptional regulator [Nocardioides sp. QY071]